eukprot:5186366-Prymnesium_polylepis.1
MERDSTTAMRYDDDVPGTHARTSPSCQRPPIPQRAHFACSISCNLPDIAARCVSAERHARAAQVVSDEPGPTGINDECARQCSWAHRRYHRGASR